MRLLLCTLALALAACGGSSDLASASYAGTWAGEGRQWDDGDRSREPSATWPLRVTLRTDGTPSGTIDYPTLGCGGTLEYAGANAGATSQVGDMVFRETLTYGTDACATGGTVLLRPSGRDLIYAWSIDGYAAEAAARLERE